MRASNLQQDLAIEAAKAGDEIAFESLYRRYWRSVYVWCLRMTGDVPDAEDLTQEVFLQVYRKVASFCGEAAFGTWLYKVAMNVTRMQFRKRRIETTSLNYLLELDECTGGLELPIRSHPPSLPLQRITLARALSSLSQTRRNVVLLHDVQGLTHREIAHDLRVSISASKSQLHQAHRRLREILVRRSLRAHRQISAPCLR
jgi:RNA polymerase sigma-70 factor, ECF subfamily